MLMSSPCASPWLIVVSCKVVVAILIGNAVASNPKAKAFLGLSWNSLFTKRLCTEVGALLSVHESSLVLSSLTDSVDSNDVLINGAWWVSNPKWRGAAIQE